MKKEQDKPQNALTCQAVAGLLCIKDILSLRDYVDKSFAWTALKIEPMLSAGKKDSKSQFAYTCFPHFQHIAFLEKKIIYSRANNVGQVSVLLQSAWNSRVPERGRRFVIRAERISRENETTCNKKRRPVNDPIRERFLWPNSRPVRVGSTVVTVRVKQVVLSHHHHLKTPRAHRHVTHPRCVSRLVNSSRSSGLSAGCCFFVRRQQASIPKLRGREPFSTWWKIN